MKLRALALLLLALPSCSSPKRVAETDWVPVPSPDLGPIVARVGQVPLYAKQVLAVAKQTGETEREALDDLVALYLLAERARQAGQSPAGSTDTEVESALVQRLLERELEPRLRPEDVPDSVLRPLYDRALDGFVHPRLVEAGILAVYTGALMKDERLQQRAQTAKELAAFVHEHPARSLDEFSAVASDPAWSVRGVVFGRFIQGPDRPLSRAIGAEVVKLRSVGETTPLLSDEDGYFIARYIDERPPENVTFEQARGKLVAAIYDRWRQQEFLAFTSKLMQAHQVLVNFDRLPTDEQGP